MLRTLSIWNFALIEHTQIEFERGLNILTGETGAGKSILIDALGAVLGHRVAADVIRNGCEWMRVEAVFDTAGEDALIARLSEQAIPDEDGTLIITRQVTAKGKNIILMNGCHVTVATLRTFGDLLADIHGQHENLALLKSESRFELVDGSDGRIVKELREHEKKFCEWKEAEKSLSELKAAARDISGKADMLRWQAQEIEAANLAPGEDEELAAEVKRLSNAEKITENLEEAYTLLSGGDDSDGILGAAGRVRKNIVSLARYDESFEDFIPLMEEAIDRAREVFYGIRDSLDGLDFDARRLDEMMSRLDRIDRLRKKYGETIGDILDYHEKIRRELESLDTFEIDAAELEKKERDAHAAAESTAKKLTKLRESAAKNLSSEISRQLRSLGMPDARFTVTAEPAPLSENGMDSIEISFSANAGEQEKPLSKVASGGELSRVSLAIKAVSAASAAGSMVFDEIDTGIGGKTAQMVAEKIALVASKKQVLCITHLPQIAAMADAHYRIQKTTRGGKTTTAVERLTASGRVEEIARMTSGTDATDVSRENAMEMMERAARTKKGFEGSNE